MAAPRAWRSALATAASAAVALLAVACTDSVVAPTAQAPTPDGPAGGPSLELSCVASVKAGSITCQTPAPSTGGADAVIYGGQNTFVRMLSANTAYNSGTGVFTTDVRLQNLLPQVIGSVDGVNVHANGIRVFYAVAPYVTSGSGSVTATPVDGNDSFLNGPADYYQWNQLLKPDSISTVKQWAWNVDATVNTFAFKVYVSAEVTPSLVITEVMANPNVPDDSTGEYVELYNPGLAEVDLGGYRLQSRSGSSTEFVILPAGVKLAPRAYGVIAARSSTVRNGGVTTIAEWGGTAIQLSNSTSATAPDYVSIRRPGATAGTFVTMDSVVWAVGGSTVAPPTGRSRELLDVKADNTVLAGAAWNTAYKKYGPGDDTGEYDRGTPGAANGIAVAVGPVASLRISPGFLVIDTLKQFRRFSAVAEDSLGQTATTTVTWTSLNPSVATIDATGLVTHVDTGQVHLVATAANGMADTTFYSIFKYSPTFIYRSHVEFGIPTPGGGNNDLLILSDKRTHYNLSYNASRGGPNWVSWDLNRTHFGKATRATTFTADALLASYGITAVVDADYVNSGYTRGHMTQSEQRTQTRAQNDTTFLLSQILPQTYDLNTGPWGDLEDYGNDLARFQQKEIYNIAGGLYPASPATLKNAGKVAIPTSTWKIMVIMPYGRGLADVTSASDIRVIAVNMPNVDGIAHVNWTTYKVTVDQLEAWTGYDFLSSLPDAIEAQVEAAIDP
ncbi:MAG TPA: DNA/RNA non-specific endonuclease [Longimicrobium sp.]|jgi:endonuclease G|uniref:DNA/RNA non-specific endonuclease n=1 Tax=Longimicrobium sp. TaxID=2029185 RepID=UPI002EDA2EE9